MTKFISKSHTFGKDYTLFRQKKGQARRLTYRIKISYYTFTLQYRQKEWQKLSYGF